MPLEYEDTITTDVNKRLEELFERQDDTPGNPNAYLHAEKASDHFNRLARLVDSIGAEFSYSEIEMYQSGIKSLKTAFRDQKVLSMFLRLLDSVGRFIRDRRLNTNQGAIKLLKKCFEDTRLVASSPDMSLSVQKKILYNDIMDLKNLKEIQDEVDRSIKGKGLNRMRQGDIEKVRTREQLDEGLVKPAAERTPNMDQMTPHEAFAIALVQIQTMIKSEFSALRAELQMWRKGQ